MLKGLYDAQSFLNDEEICAKIYYHVVTHSKEIPATEGLKIKILGCY
jgi:hypothetical protein